MKAACFLLLLLAGCCHERFAVTPPEGAAAGRPAAATSDKRCQSDCALTIAMRQLTGQSSIELEFTVANASRDRSLWVSSRPRVGVGHPERRTTEIELHLIDHNGRGVVERCLELGSGDGSPSYVALPPDQAVTTRYSIGPGCYLLDPGEILNAVATYAPTEDRPENPPGTIAFDQSVTTPSWQQIVVPKDWKLATR
jgi:hypothetical protein